MDEFIDLIEDELEEEPTDDCQLNPDCFLGDGHPGECATE